MKSITEDLFSQVLGWINKYILKNEIKNKKENI